jgi:alpha-L-fucosidase
MGQELPKSWFDDARFGMFVHWGHSSQQGIELSWPLVGSTASTPYTTNVTVDDYHATAATFDPQRWDARELARTAKRCGMRYAVLTAKHHDGFAMWHTRKSDFSIEHAPFKRDIVREFCDAMRAEGIRAGLYFSLIDWHRPDYPAFTEADKPYVFPRLQQPAPEQWERFIAFMFAQVRELLTEYGTIDVIWFDGFWERTRDQWRADALISMIRELQPEILINDRIWPRTGDFDTPEQFIPPQTPARRWETCMTMNESWGYNLHDDDWKPARALVHALCEVAGRGGNLLLNVSPMGDGALPAQINERLDVIAGWMSRNAEAIHDTVPALQPWQFYGPATRRGDRVYLHLLMRPYESVSVRGVRVRRLKSVRALSTGEELSFRKRTSIVDAMYNRNPLGEVTIAVPESALDEYATVLALDFAGEPV